MSATISPSTGLRYGTRRVCRVWEAPRSSVYLRRQEKPEPQRRGPKPLIPDAALAELIREDLAASPFREEGHRPVYFRFKRVLKIPVAPKRVLRVMRENGLLSPQRAPKGTEKAHDGRICTDAPDTMWGTDGTMARVVEEGNVWVFGAVDHWNAELVGIHVCKIGDRFNALEPIRQGLKKHYGGLTAAIAAGLALRTDHGSQYLSNHFGAEIKHWGIRHSLALVGEPQTNGVIERFWKTFKKQVLEGRIYQTLADLREAVRAWAALYNREWRVGKLKGLSPDEARQAWRQNQAAA